MNGVERMENVMEPDDGGSSPTNVGNLNMSGDVIVQEEYQGAAECIADGRNLYSEIWEQDDLYHVRNVSNPYYPFSGCIEWEVVQWLHSLNAPMDKVDAFFKLQYVSFPRIIANGA